MGLRRWFAWLGKGAAVTAADATFSSESEPKPIDQMFAEMRYRSGAIGRDEALTVPGVLKGRNLVCSVATLPLQQLNARNEVAASPLLEQIDRDVANVVTIAQTVEDLYFEAISWWRITAFDAGGFPSKARRLEPSSVSIVPPAGRTPAPLPAGDDPRGAVVWVDGVETPGNLVIRFDSPNPGVLKAAGRTIRRAVLYAEAADMYAKDPRMLDFFTPAVDAEPMDDPEVEEVLEKWRSARRRRVTGFVPAAMQHNTVDQVSPADLQLAELQQKATLDVANAMGVDPEVLGVNTTSRVYANAVDRRRDRINDVLAPYMKAITDRLSMGDVTRSGHRVVFDLDDYLTPNPLERWQVYKIAKELQALSVTEIRHKEQEPEIPEPTAPAPVAAPANVTPIRRVAAAAPAAHNFNGNGLTFVDMPVEQFAVNAASRTITGVVMPYGQVGHKYGVGFRFERGSVQWGDPTHVKLLRDHDFKQPLGYAAEIRDMPDGLHITFKVARGEEGDRALELAEDKVLDGLSVGVDFENSDTVPDQLNRGGVVVRRSDLREVSLTAMPTFTNARVTRVAASQYSGGNAMHCNACQHEHAPGVACVQPAQQPAVQQPAQQPAPFGGGQQQPAQFAGWPAQQQPAQVPAPDAMAQFNQLAALLASGQLSIPLQPAQQPAVQIPEQRQEVNPTRLTASTAVTEPAPYRFDRKGNLLPGSHDFSSDLFAWASGQDQAAHDRAIEFVRAQFDVTTGDVGTLNPTRQRPDMYVDQRSFRYPIWESINKGALSDITPFQFPKFDSAAGLVGNHTEGTEPTSGTFDTTGQTVTPTAMSGKAKIRREVWDQGGNPQVSNLIWRQMTKAWFEALEAFAVSTLDAVTPTQITLPAGATNDTLVDALTAALTLLQFVRGGFTMDNAYGQVDLYKALAAAKGSDGRKLLPVLGPTNADGTARSRWSALDINGVTMWPAWALAASGTVPASSYLFDTDSVHGWASPPQRLDITMTEVANVYIGLWGYKAAAVSDLAGVREIVYDPTV